MIEGYKSPIFQDGPSVDNALQKALTALQDATGSVIKDNKEWVRKNGDWALSSNVNNLTVQYSSTLALNYSDSVLSGNVIQSGLDPRFQSSGSALSGQVPVADGLGNITWQAPTGTSLTVSPTTTVSLQLAGPNLQANVLQAGLNPANQSSTGATAGQVLTAQGDGTSLWEDLPPPDFDLIFPARS